jgi:hypothetical protein
MERAMKIYHTTTLEGLLELLENYNEEDVLCCSTEKRDRIFNCNGGDVVLEMNISDDMIVDYSNIDIDAQKDFGWDEARIQFENADQIIECLESCIVKDAILEAWENEDEETVEMFDAIFEYIGYRMLENRTDAGIDEDGYFVK